MGGFLSEYPQLEDILNSLKFTNVLEIVTLVGDSSCYLTVA